MKRCLAAIAIVAICAGPVFAKRKPKPTSQPDITQGCVSVVDIRSHALNLFSGVGAYEPGMDATVVNSCPSPEFVSISIAYFDSKGDQIGEGAENFIVAASAKRPFLHEAALYDYRRGAMKTAKVITVQALPASQ